MPKSNRELNEKEMNVVGHLTELRNRLMVTGLIFIVLFIVSFINIRKIYLFFRNDIPFELHITSPGEIVWIYITIAAVVALVGTLPILSIQLWLFIQPGLTKRERKASLSYIPFIFILFVGGLVFGYFMFIELILPFLLSLNDEMFVEIFTVEKYFGFMFKLLLPFALIFELPVVAMFLTTLGIITPEFLKKSRKYAYFVLLIVGALVTPPDIFLQLVVAIPLFILYEISVSLASYVYKRKLRKQRQDDEEN